MKDSRGILWFFVAMTMVSLSAAAYAGIGDKIKKKANDTASKAANDAVNKAPETPASKPDEAGASTPSAPGTPAPAEEVSRVSTKFDYVPGDKVLFYDDFTRDELGEFPAAWQLRTGTFEVAELDGRRWLRCTSADSDIRMKLPAMPALPEYWTLEFDFMCEQASGNVLTVFGIAGTTEVWSAVFPYSGQNVYFHSGEVSSNTPYEGTVWGVPHHIMFMARGNALKMYVDRQRMVSVPEINPAPGAPTIISYRLWSDKQPMITNVRFAEGNKPVADPFADGKLVTYGIYFASGSDVVEPESAPVLRQIAAYLQAKPDVKLRIVGHTDNQGQPDGNLDLSRRRAAAVAAVLAGQFKIAADRFQTDGKGDTVPVSDNAKPEGRAMNRRVEFSKV